MNDDIDKPDKKTDGPEDRLSPMQALFLASYVSNCASEDPDIEAYRAVFPGSKTKNPAEARILARKFMDHPDLRAALASVIRPVLSDAQCTLKDHLTQLAALRDDAWEARKYSTAVRAEYYRGVASGHYRDNVTPEVPEEPTLEQLQETERELREKLGGGRGRNVVPINRGKA